MEDLMERASKQNFVPVVDDMGHFIGIIRRKELINYLYAHSTLSVPMEHDEEGVNFISDLRELA